MQPLNKQVVLSIMLALSFTQSMHSDLAAAMAPDACASPVSLAQVTAQSQASAKSVGDAIQQAKPSQALLAFHTEDGLRFAVTTAFTPEEIDKYPQYIPAFTSHAAASLESENPQDVASISHLIEKYPDMAAYLDDFAAYKYKKGGGMNNEVRKRLNKANRKPIMTQQMALGIAQSTPVYLAAGHVASGLIGAMSNANNSFDYLVREQATNELAYDAIYEAAESMATNGNLEGANKQRFMLRLIESGAYRRAEQADAIPGQLKNDVVSVVKKTPRAVFSGLPRAVTVGIGTAALTHVALRAFDEGVGDPLPCPKYDPKSNNAAYYSCIYAKWALRNFVVPIVLSKCVVGPAYDKTTQVVRDALS